MSKENANPDNSPFITHVRSELEYAKKYSFDKKDYENKIAKKLLAVAIAVNEAASGVTTSIEGLLSLASHLAGGELLSIPTNDPDEWEKRTVDSSVSVISNKRNPMFLASEDYLVWFDMRNKIFGVSIDINTGKPVKGVKAPKDGDTKRFFRAINGTDKKDTEGARQTSDAGDGEGVDGASTEHEGIDAEGSQEVEDGKLLTGMDEKSQEDTGQAEGSATEPQSGKA